MGARGFKAKPTAMRLAGTPAQLAKKKAGEPTPTKIMPVRPEHLSDEAVRMWEYIAPRLFRMGVLTEVDGAALAGYCEAWADFVWACEDIKVNGRTHVASTGYEQLRAPVTIKKNSMAAMLKFGAEFGLTPSTRTGIKVGEMSDDADEFFN